MKAISAAIVLCAAAWLLCNDYVTAQDGYLGNLLTMAELAVGLAGLAGWFICIFQRDCSRENLSSNTLLCVFPNAGRAPPDLPIHALSSQAIIPARRPEASSRRTGCE
jgi:hypothetical protein